MMKLFIMKTIRLLSCIAFLFTVINVNTLCSFTGHQPAVPEQALRLKKQHKHMIQFFVKKIVKLGLHYGVFSDDELELQTFSFIIMFEQIITWGSIFGLSLIWSRFWETVVLALFYIPLRVYAGGFHARTFAGCYCLSIGMYVAMLLFAQAHPPVLLISWGAVVSIIIIIIKAPIADPNKPMESGDFERYRRMVIRLIPVELCVWLYFFILEKDQLLVFIGFAFIQLAAMLLLSPLSNRAKILQLFGYQRSRSLVTDLFQKYKSKSE